MSYELMLQKATDLYNLSRYDEAEILCRQILEAMPENDYTLNLLGLIAQQKGSHNQAVELFYLATKQKPDNPVYRFNAGFSLLQNGKIAEAEICFAKAAELSSEMKEAYYFLGVCAEKKNEPEKARNYYIKALEINPLYFEAKLALCLLENDSDKLISLSEECDDNYLINLNISKKFFDAGDYEKATFYVKKAYQLNPSDDEVCMFYGIILLKTNDQNTAREMFENALRLNPRNIHAMINLANTFSHDDNSFNKAEELYRKAIDLSPQDFDAHLNLANLLYAKGKKSEAFDEYRAAVLISPKNEALSRNLAAVMQKEGEYEEAIGLLFNAMRRDDDAYDEISANIAENLTLLHQKEPKTAVDIADNWKKSMPDNIFANHIYNSLHGLAGNNNENYSEKLFDIFAETYDETLLKINYTAAQKIGEKIADFNGVIADLGCGSGLVAKSADNKHAKFIGVDISANMLEKAKETKLYEKLIKSDVINYLRTAPKADLLVAADVLCYLSDLSDFFALAKGYKLCFSIEKLNSGKDYALLPSGRYAHSVDYVKGLLEKNGFNDIKCEETAIRYENGSPVAGCIFSSGL